MSLYYAPIPAPSPSWNPYVSDSGLSRDRGARRAAFHEKTTDDTFQAQSASLTGLKKNDFLAQAAHLQKQSLAPSVSVTPQQPASGVAKAPPSWANHKTESEKLEPPSNQAPLTYYEDSCLHPEKYESLTKWIIANHC